MPHDATSQKVPESDRALAESEASRELLRVTLSSIGDAVIATDPDGCVTSMNPVAEALTGWPASEAIGQHFEAVFHFEDAASGQPIANPLTRALDRNEASNLAAGAVLVSRDGHRVPVDDRGAPILDRDGRSIGAVLVFRDVTGLRKAQDELEALNADLERRVTDRTAALEAARARSEVLAKLADALQGARTPEAVAEVALGALGPALASSFTVVYHRDGDTLRPLGTWGALPDTAESRRHAVEGIPLEEDGQGWDVVLSGLAEYRPDYVARPVAHYYSAAFEVGAEPVPSSDGEALGVVACARPRAAGPWQDGERDLLARAAATIGLALERAEAGEALAAHHAELEARNAEQETFVYTVSHDLRQPLLAIQGMGALLEEAMRAGDVDEAAFMIERVTHNTEKMGDLLNDLLALSRASREIEVSGPVDLGPVAESVLADLGPRLSATGGLLAAPGGWPTVRYGPTDAYEVLANLLGNAAKFAGRPGEAPRVVVEWGRDGEQVRLAVSDNGPGVRPEHRERVFGLFQKLDAKAEGTGVGLAIVKRIVERHGGSVWVEDSAPPPEGLGGATFVVTMPLAE